MKEVEELEEAEEVAKAEEQPQSKEPARSLDCAPFDRSGAGGQAAARRAGRLTKM